MDAVQMLQADRQKVLEEGRSIVDAADSEGRALSDTERERAEALMKERERLDVRIADEQEKSKFRDLVDGWDRTAATGVDPNPVREPATATKSRTPGEALINSDWFRGLQAKMKDGPRPKFSSPAFEVPYPKTKAAGDPILESGNQSLFGDGTAAGALSTILGLETPGFVQPPLTIADLITNVPITTGNAAQYPVVNTRTQADGTPVVEGQAKPGAFYDFDIVTKLLETIAAWAKYSESFIEDAPGLAAYINADLPFMVRQNEEAIFADQLYAEAGSQVDGTGIGGTNGFDAIEEAKTAIIVAGGRPNAFLIHPNDWAGLLVAKNTGGDENYTGGGPFAPTGNPWNLTPVVTPSAVETIALVGDFGRGVKAYRRGGMSVTTTNSDGTDFVKNILTVRAELRVVLGVTYPEFFVAAEVNTSS